MGPFDRFNDRAKRVLALAQDEAIRFNHNYIGTEHLLLGLVREGEGVGVRILLDLDVDAERIRNEVIRALPGSAAPFEPIAPLAPDLRAEVERVRSEKEAALEAQEFEKAASLRTRERNLVRLGRDGEVEGFWEEARRPLPAASVRLPRSRPRRLRLREVRPGAKVRDIRTLSFLAGGATFGVALGVGILIGRLIWG